MQAVDLWNGNDSSDPAWHDRAGVWTILVEREMSARLVVVVDIC